MANNTQFSDLAMWVAHYDNVPAFSDWFPFSGWQNPRVKQFYDGPDVCGVSARANKRAGVNSKTTLRLFADLVCCSLWCIVQVSGDHNWAPL